MARNLVATTAREMMKAARAMVAGATRTATMTAATAATTATAVTATTMTPNNDKYNEDSNSKNNDKAMITLTATTEGGEHCQSCRDNCGGGHRHPKDAAIALTAASARHAFIGSCYFLVGRSILYYAWEYIVCYHAREE